MKEEWMPIKDDYQTQTNESKQLMLEMAQIAEFSGYEIVVWSNDPGNIPHFHIYRGNPAHPEFDACIKIKSAEYFPHGGKHTDKLSRKERKDLVAVLNSPHPDLITSSCWQFILALWNSTKSHQRVSPNTPIPDYLHMV